MTEQPTRRLSRRNVLKSAAIGGAAIAATAAAPAGGALKPSSAATAGDGVPAEPLRLARVWFEPGQAALLNGFDDTHVVFDDGSVELLLWPGDLARLEATGLRYRVTVDDLAARDAALVEAAGARTVGVQPGETETGEYRTLEQYNADLMALAEAHPDKARVFALPNRTLEGREVLGIEICTDVARRDGRPVFYNDGIHHAREWPAGEVPIMWAYDLLENYGSDDRITTIVDNVRNIVVPVVNVDGFNHSRSFPVGTGGADLGTGTIGTYFGDGAEAIVAGGQGRYWRKNRRSFNGSHVANGNPLNGAPQFEKPANADAYGIDPNRNYAFAWGGDGSSPDELSQTYRGTQPFSEPEAQNVQAVFERYQVTASISHHTSGDLILWAWGDTYDDAPDNAVLEGIGRAMAVFNGYRPQKGIQLYVTTGTASDYMYGSRASIAYTFEHAGSAFHPDYLDTVPAMYQRNRGALLLLCEQLCLLPEDRPDYTSLPPKAYSEMAARGVRLDDLHHAVLRGRLVDASGQPVAGEVKLFKRYDVRLWRQDGDGSENPLGQRDFTEIQETIHATAADGSFEIHCNPSTQPKLEAAGERVPYELTFRSGDHGAFRSLVVERGAVTELGDVTVG